MSKTKILVITSLVLLGLNLLLVWIIFSHKPGGPGKEPKWIIIEKLHLDESQKKEYEKLISWHRANIEIQQKKIRPLKENLYLQLNKSNSKSSVDSLIAEIGKVQTEIEHIHFKHFQDIQSLCKPEQMPAFENLSKELAKLFAPHDRKHENK